MANRNPQSALKRAREQTLREKRELKQAKREARAVARRVADHAPTRTGEADTGTDLG